MSKKTIKRLVIKWVLYVNISIADVQNHYKLLRSGLTITLVHIYKEIRKLHTSGVTHFLLVTVRGSTLQTVHRAFQNVWGVCGPGLLQRKKKKKERRLEIVSTLYVSTCGWAQSLHGQPYPAAPQELLHVQQVDSQSSLQLLARSLWAPAVCAVHGHTQEWHQQEEASEQGEVGARRCSLIGCGQKKKEKGKQIRAGLSQLWFVNEQFICYRHRSLCLLWTNKNRKRIVLAEGFMWSIKQTAQCVLMCYEKEWGLV